MLLNGFESGGGFFPARFFVSSGPAIRRINAAGQKERKNHILRLIDFMKTQLDYRIPLLNPAGILAICLSLFALLLLPPSASAASVFFSTGSPDGLIGTLSRPASAGLQTETADDFVLSQCVVITEATFTGLIPSMAPLTSITNVEVEFYHVFPTDSDTNRTITVPTRMNSPADIEISSATRNSSADSLSFNPAVVNPVFTAMNSVVNGIHAGPPPFPFTGGEGPVTGEEVRITVTFSPPILLSANHYFFRPEVGLNSGNFLWLSAPKPVNPPLFVGDLQSWIRNDNLAPDWLRIGTDITHQGPFNASFSLSGETDVMSMINALVPCSGPATGGTWKNHGQYVSSVAHAAQSLANQGCIGQQQKGKIVSAAARSNCGKNKPKKH